MIIKSTLTALFAASLMAASGHAQLVTALIGAWLVTVTMVSYFIRPMNAAPRLAFGVTGLVLLLPMELVQFAGLANLIAVAIAAAFVAMKFSTRRRSARA